MTDDDLPMDQYRRAGLEITRGNPEVYKSLWSRRGDVTLANPFGPPVVATIDPQRSRLGGSPQHASAHTRTPARECGVRVASASRTVERLLPCAWSSSAW